MCFCSWLCILCTHVFLFCRRNITIMIMQVFLTKPFPVFRCLHAASNLVSVRNTASMVQPTIALCVPDSFLRNHSTDNPLVYSQRHFSSLTITQHHQPNPNKKHQPLPTPREKAAKITQDHYVAPIGIEPIIYTIRPLTRPTQTSWRPRQPEKRSNHLLKGGYNWDLNPGHSQRG